MATVAIIGGGCAGLGAAQALLEKNQTVVLIDAYARLGGRAWTMPDQGFPFDLGPQFIQDPEVNPWATIATELGFETIARDDDAFKTIYRVEIQSVWQDSFGLPGMDPFEEQLKDGYESAILFANMPPITKSFGRGQDAQLALGSNGIGSIAESAEPWQYIASDKARQKDGSGKVLYVKRGLGTLVQEFGADLQRKYRAFLTHRPSTVVTCVRFVSAQNQCEVFAGDQQVSTCDYCIVTVPCSALPAIAFIPPLSHERLVANGYIVLGSYKKVAFQPQQMPQQIQQNAEYYLYDNNLKACWQYFRLPTAPQALIGVASGNFAASLDRKADNDAATSFVTALSTAYGQQIVSTQPPMVTNWSKQQQVWGAYSYTRYDGGNSDDPAPLNARIEIGKSHANGRILFAGEATWTDAYGTIHGAYNSGVRAARVILQNLGI